MWLLFFRSKSCNTFVTSMTGFVLTLQNITALPESCVWAWPHLHAQHKDVSGARKPIALSQKQNKTTQQIHTRPGKNQCTCVCACMCGWGGGSMRNDCELRTAHHRSLPKGTLTGLCPDVWEADRAQHDPFSSINLLDFQPLGIVARSQILTCTNNTLSWL